LQSKEFHCASREMRRMRSTFYLLTIGFLFTDTRLLQSLLAVVDCGSMAEPARRLHVTPAAVAQRIHALESELGTRLEVRSGQTMRPAAAAATIVGRARDLLGVVRDIRSMVAGDVLAGELRLGALQTAQCGLLADAVITSTSVPEADAHTILAREPFIRLDRKIFSGQLIDACLRKAGIRPKERLELDGLELIAQLVDRRVGVSLLPDWAPPWPEGLALRKRALPDRSFRRRTGLLWKRASLRARLINAFLEQARLVLADQGKTMRKSRMRA